MIVYLLPPSAQFLPSPPVSHLQLAAEGGRVGEPSGGPGDKVRVLTSSQVTASHHHKYSLTSS